MSCERCGAPHHPDSKRCAYCGGYLPASRRAEAASPKPPPAQPMVVNVYQSAPVAEPAPLRRQDMASDKSRWIAALLCWFLGYLGVHRFYVRKTGTGILWLFTGGLMGIGVIVDFIVILLGNFRDKDGLKLKE